MSRYRTQGILAAGLGLLLTGCFSDPDLKTALRPEGPPEVLAVLALDLNTGHEGATFCKYVGSTLDEKGPGLVQGSTICPTDMADYAPEAAEPLGWGIRIVFDELLNGDAVETLDCDADGDGIQDDPITTCDGHIDTTQPVGITCTGVTGAVAYDGYYVPNGNKDSFPVGPSIVVFPDNTAPTGSTCTLTINPVVVDKQGEGVATGAETGTFTMQIADLTLVETDPEDAEDVADRAILGPSDPVAFYFNAYIDEASIAITEVILTTDAGVIVPSTFAVTGDGTGIEIAPVTDLVAGNYTAKITATAEIAELNGGTTTFATEVAVRYVVE